MVCIKKRLAIITPSSGFGGGEKWCRRLAEAAKAALYIPTLVPFVGSSENMARSGAQVANWCGWSRSTVYNLMNLRRLVRSFECALNDIAPSLVICATWPAALICLYLKSQQRFPGKLLIVFHRQIQEVLFRSSWFNLLVPVKLVFFRRYLRLADKVVVLNESSRQVLRKWMGIEPSVISNGVDIGSIRIQSTQEVDVSVDTPYVVFLGRLEKEKGLDLLLHSFSFLTDSALKLILVGNGPFETRLRSLVLSLNLDARVHFAGYRENPFPFLRGASVLIVPSPWECQPLVVLEAFSLGVPVIGVDNPGMRDLLGDGSRGFLCPGNEVSIASAIREVLNSGQEVERRVAAGIDYVEKHGEQLMFARYFKIMEEIE